VYSLKNAGATITRAPDGGTGQGDFVDGPRRCFGGGAGLLSTAADYARFLQMLLNGGELDGVRILGPKSVEMMASNHVGALYSDGNLGFGLGFEIIEHVAGRDALAPVGRLRLGQRLRFDPTGSIRRRDCGGLSHPASSERRTGPA